MKDDVYFVDESLAKGLASRFMNETSDRLDDMSTNLAAVSGYSTKKGWRIHARKVESIIKPSTYGTFWLGSSSDPALVIIGMDGGRSQYKDWSERMLTANILALTYRRCVIGPFPLSLTVSHHCLARIIQRTRRLNHLPDRWDFDGIKRLFTPILGWAAFWKTAVFLPTLGSQILKGKKLSECTVTPYILHPVVPSPDGLFFCETSSQDKYINVRTFVATEQLDESQVALRTFLMSCYSGFERTPIATHPWGYFENFFDARDLCAFLQQRLATKEFFVKEFLYANVPREYRNSLEELGFLRRVVDDSFDPFSISPTALHQYVIKHRRSNTGKF